MYWWWIRWRILWWNDDKYYEDYLYECDEEYNNVIDDDYRIDELIDSLDEEILKDVLKYLLENNSSARRSFLKYINNEDDNINIENLKESIYCIFYENSDDEYIGYDEASVLWNELNDFIDRKIEPLIELQRYMEAVELILHLASSFYRIWHWWFWWCNYGNLFEMWGNNIISNSFM